MTPQRALVTGATGFVGSHLVKQLLSEGWSVHVIARADSSLEQLPSMPESMAMHRFDGNIESMREIVRESGPDIVFHLASLFLSEHQPRDIRRLVDSNLLFGTQLVEAMSLEGVHYLVNTGTSWQHYENHEYSPVNLYAATKRAFEILLQYYVEARDLRVITLKLCDTYGPNDPRQKLINLLQSVAASNQELAMSPGEQRIDLVYVADVARAYVVAANRLLANRVNGLESYAITSGNSIQLRELVRLAEQLLGRQIPVIWGGRPYRLREVMEPWISGKALPGWTPRVALRDGLLSTIEAGTNARTPP